VCSLSCRYDRGAADHHPTARAGAILDKKRVNSIGAFAYHFVLQPFLAFAIGIAG